MRHAVTGGLLLLLCLASPPLARPVPPAIPELDRDAYAALLAEHRGLSSIYQSYDAEEVAVMAVRVAKALGRLQRFLFAQELTYPVYQGDLDLKREQGRVENWFVPPQAQLSCFRPFRLPVPK